MATADDLETKIEIEDAKEDLRDALHQVNNRVEEGVARLRPDRGIRKHPVTSACIAGGLGFALGAGSGEVALIGLLLLGAIVLTRENKVGNSDES
jgi:ElaB/YqjD/DUF883 family membrane-anchored ribosome-binding protein